MIPQEEYPETVEYIIFPVELLRLLEGGRVFNGKHRTLKGFNWFLNYTYFPLDEEKLQQLKNEFDININTLEKRVTVNIRISTLCKFIEGLGYEARFEPELGFLTSMSYLPEEIPTFDGIQLLAFCALKSIIGVQVYKPIKWDFVLSRMAGRRKIVKRIPKWIEVYRSRRMRDKLIKALTERWGLKYYAQGVRTPLFSFSHDIDLAQKVKQKKHGRKTAPFYS